MNDLLARLLSRPWLLHMAAYAGLLAQALDASKAKPGGAAAPRGERDEGGSAEERAARSEQRRLAMLFPLGPVAAAGGPAERVDLGGFAGYQLAGPVAVVDLWGVLDKTDDDVTGWMGARIGTSYDSLGRSVRAAMADPRAGSVLLRVDSPGGAALPVGDTADELYALAGVEQPGQPARAGRAAKPVVAYADRGVMASAALYLASQSRAVYTSGSAWIGSIGTIMYHADFSRLLAEWGIDVTAIKSFAGKDAGSPHRPLSDADKAILQKDVDALDAQFRRAVARGRGLSLEAVTAVRNEVGFIGPAAVAAGLADAVVGSLDALIGQLAEAYPANPANVNQPGSSAAGPGRARTRAGLGAADGFVPPLQLDQLATPAFPAPALAVASPFPSDERTRAMKYLGLFSGLCASLFFDPLAGLGAGGAGLSGAPAEPEKEHRRDAGATGAKPPASGLALTPERLAVNQAIIQRAAVFAGHAGIAAIKDQALAEGWSVADFSDRAVQALVAERPAAGPLPGLADVRVGATGADKQAAATERAMVFALAEPVIRQIVDNKVADNGQGPEGRRATADRMARALGFDSAEALRVAAAGDNCDGLRGQSIVQLARRQHAGQVGGYERSLRAAPDDQALLDRCMFGRPNRRSVGRRVGGAGGLGLHGGGGFEAAAGMGSSDLPSLLLNAQNKVGMAAFTETVPVWSDVCMRINAADFKAQPLISLSGVADLQAVAEGEEPTFRTLNDRREQVVVQPQQLAMRWTLQMLRGDDLGLLGRLTAGVYASAARRVDKIFIAALTANSGMGPTLINGNQTLFHSTRNNTGSGALGYDTVRAAWTNMASRTGFGASAEEIEVEPTVLLVAKTSHWTAVDLVTQEFVPGSANTTQRNTLRSAFAARSTPRLTGNPWWLFHLSAQRAAFAMAFLDGQETPIITERDTQNPLFTEILVTIPGVGCAGLDPEAGYRSTGQ